MTMENGQQQVLNPERTSVSSSKNYLKNQVNTDLMKQQIKYSYQNQLSLKKIEYTVQLPLNQETL